VHKQLVTASHEAGMAEVATGVLHNVGNVSTASTYRPGWWLNDCVRQKSTAWPGSRDC